MCKQWQAAHPYVQPALSLSLMTVVVTWNIQYGKGVDGVIDLRRMVETVQKPGPVDILCLQEVAVNFTEMGGGECVDQGAEIAAMLSGYEAVYAAAINLRAPDGSRRKFGNLILSRMPILQAASHLLPRPNEAGVQHMQRGVAMAVVKTPRGPLRVLTTHFEYHSAKQRQAQADRLRALYAEAVANERYPTIAGPGPYQLHDAAIGTVICGDFNFEPTEPPYETITAPFGDGTEALRDAWSTRYPGKRHAPTCGVHDRKQWQQGAHARDFMFVSAGIASALDSMTVDVETMASDHQPVRAVFAD